MIIGIGEIIEPPMGCNDSICIEVANGIYGVYNDVELRNSGMAFGDHVVVHYEPQDQFVQYVPVSKLKVA